MEKKKTTTKSKKVPTKDRNMNHIFGLFVLWSNMPKYMRGMDEKGMDKLGVDDEETREIMKLPTKTAFAEHYGIDRTTLVAWSKREDFEISMKQIQKWAERYAPDVIGSIIAHTTKTKGTPVPAMYDKFFHLVMNKSSDPTQQLAEQQAKILERLSSILPD